jgi:hypothetical protein
MAAGVDYPSFKRRFDQAYANLKLPPECIEQKPPTVTNVRLFSWTFDWVLIFNDDNKYLRVRESHDKVAGLLMSRRLGFAFHYGPIVKQGASGDIIRESTDPVDIRIDKSRGHVHMHYQAPGPHYTQEKVKGLTLDSVDMLRFVRAVLQHRQSGKSISEILGFEIG